MHYYHPDDLAAATEAYSRIHRTLLNIPPDAQCYVHHGEQRPKRRKLAEDLMELALYHTLHFKNGCGGVTGTLSMIQCPAHKLVDFDTLFQTYCAATCFPAYLKAQVKCYPNTDTFGSATSHFSSSLRKIALARTLQKQLRPLVKDFMYRLDDISCLVERYYCTSGYVFILRQPVADAERLFREWFGFSAPAVELLGYTSMGRWVYEPDLPAYSLCEDTEEDEEFAIEVDNIRRRRKLDLLV